MVEYRLVLERIPNQAAQYWTVLQVKDTPASAWRTVPTVMCSELTPAERAEVMAVLNPTCPVCHGNNREMPCAYPGEHKPGCLKYG